MRPARFLVVGFTLLAGCDGGNTPNTPTPVTSATPTPAPAPTPTPTPAAASVTGVWRSEARSWDIRLEQTGSTLRGNLLGFKDQEYSNPGHPDLQITGTITAAGAVEFSASAFSLSFDGVVAPGGMRMTGTLRDCVTVCRNYGEILNRK